MKQRTIKKPVEVVGIGLHKGVPVNLRLEPLEEDSGIVFYRSDKAVSIPLSMDYVVDTKMATVIGKNGVVISTIEHLLSAIYAYGIDNIRIIVDDGELPILDGSSRGFCMLLDGVGIKEQTKNKKAIIIKKPIEIKVDNKVVKLLPSNHIIYDFSIDFEQPAIGEQQFKLDYSVEEYKEKALLLEKKLAECLSTPSSNVVITPAGQNSAINSSEGHSITVLSSSMPSSKIKSNINVTEKTKLNSTLTSSFSTKLEK